MAYTIPFSDTAAHPTAITVNDQTLNTEDTSLTFVGKNYPGYSLAIGSNFLHLLENFASSTAPSNPVQGQLWYDTGTSYSPSRPQLKIYDGTNWTEAGNIKKGASQPSSVNSIVGDLWVDTSAQQLYLYTGATWVLVGPQFNAGSLAGLKAETVIDRDSNTEKTILIFYTGGIPVIIISKDTFTPKVAIQGFEIIRQGVNMSSDDFDLDGTVLNKYWGVSEKANSLIVGNNVIPATNFLRSDAVSTTNYTINIRNGGGLVVGASLETSLTTSSTGAILTHKTQGSPIILRTTTSGGITNDVITVAAGPGADQGLVGINKNPTTALDVNGDILTNGSIVTTDTTASTSTTTGALKVAGGVGISGSLYIGNNTSVLGQITVGGASAGQAVVARANEKHDIGTSGTRFRAVYAKDFVGQTFTGSFVGSFSGSVSGTASSLATTSAFSMTGDISSNVIPFNGAEPVPPRSITFVARSALGIATVTTSVAHGYVTGYIVELTCSNSTFNTTLGGQVITVTGLTTFTYQNSGSTLTTTAASGTITVKPGGSFYTVLNDDVISSKTEISSTSDSDYFLVYRATATPALRKISKATLFSTAGTVPTGSIFPFAGDTPPVGYLLCDGSEQSQSAYPELFSVLGYKYRAAGLLTGYATFAIPDLRGRFALGRDDMDNGNSVSVQITATSGTRLSIAALSSISATFVIQNSLTTNGPFQTGKVLTGHGLDTSAGPVTITAVTNNTPSSGYTTITVSMPPQPTTYPAASGLVLESVGTIDGGGGTANRVPSATAIGNVSGSRQTTLGVSNLPEHLHDLKDSANNQYYALRNATGTPPDPEVIASSVHFTSSAGHLLQNSGGIKTTGSLGQPIDIMNPYQTINYIIFTGRII
jgi:microcystin-dependent protein